ncbi:type II toxin-antitoxin system VapC family toxin [Thiocystis violacea]|uniref:type II toxin-antitoxin system VapC family toxin n=1 Tax=Thiocystis violacea TaxID=13725 RepID=UPI001907D9D3|nr:PIN domain-containing protein [Thiocystis violacea]MBK1723247.1 twitching motility protein PilT [Thiocystis violacea]
MNGQTKALFDVSVLADALMNDSLPMLESSEALTLAADGQVEGYLCAAAVEFLNDMLTRAHGHPSARAKIIALRNMLAVAPVDSAVIDAAMALGWHYLDDAMTHECARVNGLDAVVTLNPSDFAAATLPILAPRDLLKQLKGQGPRH